MSSKKDTIWVNIKECRVVACLSEQGHHSLQVSRSELCKCFIQQTCQTTGKHTFKPWQKVTRTKNVAAHPEVLYSFSYFLIRQRESFCVILDSYLIYILGFSWVSAVANQPWEAHWAGLSGPSCNTPRNEDILVSYLGERAAGEMTLISAEGVGVKIEIEEHYISFPEWRGHHSSVSADLWLSVDFFFFFFPWSCLCLIVFLSWGNSGALAWSLPDLCLLVIHFHQPELP